MPSNTNEFIKFNLSPEIIQSLTMLHYLTPTQIQEEAIPVALSGRDILGQSNTGTGKTAAFGIPICEKISWDEFLPQALILEPTRELADQVKTELFHIGRIKRLKVPVFLGGMPMDKQLLSLKQKAHIIVGTPGRIMDHVRRKSLDLSNIKYLVIDEADLMLNMGFEEEVQSILANLPENRVTMLFSATMGIEIQQLAASSTHDPVTISIESPTGTVPIITEEVYYVQQEQKYNALLSLLEQENPDNAMIFCATREMVNTLLHKLTRDHIRCGMLHGDMDQRKRLLTIDEFRTGHFHYLICTDVAARGIDFDNITHVIHYDFPTGRETYVHRTGRTGRNYQSGKALSLVTSEELTMKLAVESYTGKHLVEKTCPSPSDRRTSAFWKRQKERSQLKERKGTVFHKSITRLAIGGGKKSKMRTIDIVGTICSIEGILPEDIGIIDIRESISFVEILNDKGELVYEALQKKSIKGRPRKVNYAKGI